MAKLAKDSTTATLELTAPQLVLLYNLLISEIVDFLDRVVPDPDMNALLEQTNQALEILIGESTWFFCIKQGCDDRPYRLTACELESADGIISCDVCGELCHRVLKEPAPPVVRHPSGSPRGGEALCAKREVSRRRSPEPM